MPLLRWNNQNQLQARHQTSVFQWREGWMARTIPRPRWREKNVLDIPLYRPGHSAQNPCCVGLKRRPKLNEDLSPVDRRELRSQAIECTIPGATLHLRIPLAQPTVGPFLCLPVSGVGITAYSCACPKIPVAGASLKSAGSSNRFRPRGKLFACHVSRATSTGSSRKHENASRRWKSCYV